MRKHFSNYIEQIVDKQDDIVFITGDLGYNALENLRQKMGDRFINSGVAEQNMISVASGIASQGFQVVCYSIAPFVVYRCLEQMRNDVCFHNLPVYVVGNGGGYHYGALGSSHHALEDIATLSGLPNINCYVPAFLEDMKECMDNMFNRRKPAYFRLGVGKNMPPNISLTNFGAATINQSESVITIIVQCPIVNNVISALNKLNFNEKVDLFIVNKMPFIELPSQMSHSIKKTKNILTIEEHISIGGIASAVSLLVNEQSISIDKFISLNAKGYPNSLYGSQAYHHKVCGLDTENIINVINSYIG